MSRAGFEAQLARRVAPSSVVPLVRNSQTSYGWPISPSKGVGISPLGSTYRRDDTENPQNNPCLRSAVVRDARCRARRSVSRLLVSHAVWGGCSGGWVERRARPGVASRYVHDHVAANRVGRLLAALGDQPRHMANTDRRAVGIRGAWVDDACRRRRLAGGYAARTRAAEKRHTVRGCRRPLIKDDPDECVRPKLPRPRQPPEGDGDVKSAARRYRVEIPSRN